MTHAERFIKIGPAGEHLPADAPSWDAVLDTQTGLMWPNSDVYIPSWSKGADAIAELKVAGFDDWRWSNVDELLTRVDRKRYNPAVLAPEYFPNIKPRWYWSSEVSASDPHVNAWGVSFNRGGSYLDHQCYEGFALAVRGGQ